MDLQLYSRVLWRWRKVLVAGLIAAMALAVLAVYKPTMRNGVPELTHRKSELWRSGATVYLTYPGFPGGRTSLTPDPNQFVRIAALYATLANSDAVRRKVLAGRTDGYYTAIPAADRTYGETTLLPMVTVLGHASTPAGAVELTERAAAGLVRYIRSQQKAAAIPESQRVTIRLLNAPSAPVNLQPRKKTLPIAVFLAVLIASIALAFVLENVRPLPAADRRRVAPAPEPDGRATLPDEVPARVAPASAFGEPVPAPEEVPPRVAPAPEPDEPEFVPEEPPVAPARRWA